MEIITPLQEVILKSFGQAVDSNHFYLTGGTALAYFYLKHRRSNDLDFFTAIEKIVDPFSRNLEKVLRDEGMTVERRRGVQSFIELFVGRKDQNTIIQLAQDAAFRFEATREFPSYPKLKVDSLRDIASNKLLALFGRAALRDFIDLYFLVREAGFGREDLMEMSAKKDPGFDLYWLGVAFERIKTFDKDSPEMLMLIKQVKFQELFNFFEEWRKIVAQKF